MAKINKVPHSAVWSGKLIPGNLLRTPLFSRLFIKIGGITVGRGDVKEVIRHDNYEPININRLHSWHLPIPGEAMAIRDITTSWIAFFAATFD